MDELAEDLRREIENNGRTVLKSETVQLLLEDSHLSTEEQFTERLCGRLNCYRDKNEDGDWEFARIRAYL